MKKIAVYVGANQGYGQYKPKDYTIQETDIEWDTCWTLKR